MDSGEGGKRSEEEKGVDSQEDEMGQNGYPDCPRPRRQFWSGVVSTGSRGRGPHASATAGAGDSTDTPPIRYWSGVVSTSSASSLSSAGDGHLVTEDQGHGGVQARSAPTPQMVGDSRKVASSGRGPSWETKRAGLDTMVTGKKRLDYLVNG